MLFMGIDVGTQGVRTVVADETGRVVASKSIPFAVLNISDVPGYNEQSPEDWKNAFEASVSDCTAQLRKAGIDVSEIRAISVDATSGTMVALDADGEPLTAGIMYNDGRAKAEAAEVHSAMTAHEKKLGLKFGSSFSLPRVLWLTRNLPEISKKAKYFAHQADYITGLLCGEYGVSDYSNALKTGFDLIDGYWPEQIAGFGINVNKLPKIVRPGAPIAHVSKTAAEKLGLSEKTMVVGGSTDGYASALAAGAVKPGNWASIIGTTFVLKGVTSDLIIDPNGSSYSHKLPDGDWLLGGAGNIGGKCLNFCADGRDFAELDKASEHLVPTGVRCYPLTGRGERFPFVDEKFEPFYIGDIWNGKLYPAIMEGVGFAERLAFEHMEALGCVVGDTIYATGGVCRSDLWLKIRASILNRALKVPEVVDAAMGSALVAASETFGSLGTAAENMIRYRKTMEPDTAMTARYDEIYHLFREDMARHTATSL